MRATIMREWAALRRKQALVMGVVALLGTSVSPVQAEVLRYHCAPGDLFVDTGKQTIAGTGSGNGAAVHARIDRRNIYWTDNDGDRHYMDRITGMHYFWEAGKWIRRNNGCRLMR